MKKKMHRREPVEQDDDVWAWVVIGLIFCGVTLATFASVVWEATHHLL
jgi:hypothetical protein